MLEDRFKCIILRDKNACVDRSADDFVDYELDPCKHALDAIAVPPCHSPDCTQGHCTFVYENPFYVFQDPLHPFSGHRLYTCTPNPEQPPGSCGALPGCLCDYDTCTANCGTTTTTTTCPTCSSEYCAACGPQANLGDPGHDLSGINMKTIHGCNLCCSNPVDICQGCCFYRLTLGDLYCCPETPACLPLLEGTCPLAGP